MFAGAGAELDLLRSRSKFRAAPGSWFKLGLTTHDFPLAFLIVEYAFLSTIWQNQDLELLVLNGNI